MAKTTAVDRKVWVHLLTSRGWVVGALRVPGPLPLVRYLNGPARFVQVDEVAGGWRGPRGAALAISKRSLLLVVPSADERVAPSPVRGRGVTWRTTLMLPAGEVQGTFDLREGITPARYLERATGFVVVEDAKLRLGSPPSTLSSSQVRVAIVGSSGLVAVWARASRA